MKSNEAVDWALSRRKGFRSGVSRVGRCMETNCGDGASRPSEFGRPLAVRLEDGVRSSSQPGRGAARGMKRLR